MDATDIAFAGIAEQARLVAAGELTSRELVELCLARIARLDGALNAFRVVLAEEALAEADARDAASGARGPLHGVPVAIKDENAVAGQVMTFGGAAQVAPQPADSEVVRRLRAAGAVILGITNMPEFGQFPFTESAAWGYTRNPWDPSRTPAGSSGGTAAAVAAGLVGAGLGGDGGGSIRLPAARCGLFGLKCQRGRVSLAPAAHLWFSLGVIGPLTRTVADSALFYDAIRGTLPSDRWSAQEPRMPFAEAARTPPGRLRIGIARKPHSPVARLGSEEAAALDATARLLRDLGHDVRDVEPDVPDVTAAFVPQFLGGARAEARTVDRPDLLERRTRRGLLLGRLVPDVVVEWAVRHGAQLATRVNTIFDEVDLLLTPTVPGAARPVGALDGVGFIEASLRAMPEIAYVALWNLAGNPAAAVPAGVSGTDLPLSVQLVGRPHDEPTVLQVAAQLEAARPWAQRRPPLA